jgi:hypothetical protein
VKRQLVLQVAILCLGLTLALTFQYSALWGSGPQPTVITDRALNYNATVNGVTFSSSPTYRTCGSFNSRGLGVDLALLVNYEVPSNLSSVLSIQAWAVLTSDDSAGSLLSSITTTTTPNSASGTPPAGPGRLTICVQVTAILLNQTNSSQVEQTLSWFTAHSLGSFATVSVVPTDPILLTVPPAVTGAAALILACWAYKKADPPAGIFASLFDGRP